MARPRQTFWDFGEEKPSPAPKKSESTQDQIVSVKELTEKVRATLEQSMGKVRVSGEISNLRIQSSGHAYFVLKDDEAQLQCVLFKSAGSESRRLLSDGLHVVATGDVTVYAPRGQYQLVVRSVVPAGLGNLQLAFEKLKARLKAEGLFAPERKRPIPEVPARLGLVTSPTGAAVKDVLHVLRRRHPGLEVVLAPCRVQGDGAAEEVSRAIDLLNEWSRKDGKNRVDVILVTRGGGSLEDLWAFNEESVARAIYRSDIPVISAIGHEIDFTISDFVADLRAATPSAAAEILSEGAVAASGILNTCRKRLRACWGARFEQLFRSVDELQRRSKRAHPGRKLEAIEQLLDELEPRLQRACLLQFRQLRSDFTGLSGRLGRQNPGSRLKEMKSQIDRLAHELVLMKSAGLEKRKVLLGSLDGKLQLLAPQRVLKRGYSITLHKEKGEVLRSTSQLEEGATIVTLLSEGRLESRVTTTKSSTPETGS